jgi:hypothetical protein
MARKGRQLDELTTVAVADTLRRLAAVVDDDLPRTYWTGEGEWPPIAAGFMARLGDIAESAALLIENGRGPDAQVLGRIMYEQAVNFCWIATDPDRRIARWKDSYRAQLRATHEAAIKYGLELLSPQELEQVQGKRKISVETMAAQADRYWSPRIAGFRIATDKKEQINLLTIEGLYLGVYRVASRIVHATVFSLDSVLRQNTSQRVVVERRKSNTVETAPTPVPIFVMAIAVHHHLFKWPDVDRAYTLSDALHWV